ncbi:hypothetical protein RSW14_24700, partial [Escherichia coli]|nr:hypothetical protein [Escherichia coli]
MFKLSSALCHVLALSFAVGTAVPAAAAPVFVPNAPAVSSDVTNVQYRRDRDYRRDNRRDRGRDRFER